MRDVFSYLPDFLKEYVHESGWRSFRSIQESAFGIIITGSSDVILSSGTSSGKTEAALFPVMASLYTNPSDGIGALYISPLKALINDQYGRISRILKRSGIDVTGWHGDIGGHVKERMKTEPKGILQMTPESLQALIGGDPDSVRRMFPGLRFVIIDEMHAFMDSERGSQLLCCLDRVERLSGCHPRRIGLSATISDRDGAKEWIRAGRSTEVDVVEGEDTPERNVAISYHHFHRKDSLENIGARKKEIADFYRTLFRVTDRNRCLIFTNSRDTAETIAKSLHTIIERSGSDREVMLHHGRLDQITRRTTEESMTSSVRDLTVVATSTLEMGIDVGNMDRIVQIDPPHSCSSLLQRMGRSGRRDNAQSMAIMCRDDDDRNLPKEVSSMTVLKAVAEVQLALDEGWTEPARASRRPYGLLVHQTLEYIRESTGVLWKDLEKDVLSQFPFRYIPREDYRILLRHMYHERLLHIMEDNTILLGTEGERVAFSRDFHTVFRSVNETEVRHNGRRIGTVEGVPDTGDVIRVNDTLWMVCFVESGGRYIEAEPVDEGHVTVKGGTIPEIDPVVMERMRKILLSDDIDHRLSSSAEAALEIIRNGLRGCASSTFEVRERFTRIHLWKGTRAFRSLRIMLDSMDDVKVIRGFEPYIIDVSTELSPRELASACDSLSSKDPTNIVSEMRMDLFHTKYDRFVPRDLLVKAYVEDHMDWRSGILQD